MRRLLNAVGHNAESSRMTMRSDWQKRLFIGSFLLPGLALYTLFFAYPAAAGLRISLGGESLNIGLRLAIEGPPAGGSWLELSGTALASFRRLLFEISDPADLYRVRRYLGNSLFLFFFSLLDLFLGLVIAAILTRKPYGARLLRVVYLFPSILSAAAATIMWVMVLNPRFGLVNQALRTIGLGGWTQPWLSQVKMLPFAPMALYAVALIGVWGSVGVAILLFAAAIENVPLSLYEAARIDGASELQSFLYVTVPLVWEMFRALLVLRVIGLFGNVAGYSTVQILFGGTGGSKVWLISNYFHYHAFNTHNWRYAAAVIIAVTGAAFVLAAATLWLTRREAATF